MELTDPRHTPCSKRHGTQVQSDRAWVGFRSGEIGYDTGVAMIRFIMAHAKHSTLQQVVQRRVENNFLVCSIGGTYCYVTL